VNNPGAPGPLAVQQRQRAGGEGEVAGRWVGAELQLEAIVGEAGRGVAITTPGVVDSGQVEATVLLASQRAPATPLASRVKSGLISSITHLPAPAGGGWQQLTRAAFPLAAGSGRPSTTVAAMARPGPRADSKPEPAVLQ